LRTYIANTTHDVMIPLTVLQGHLAAMERGAEGVEPSRVRQALEEAHYLASLLHNLNAAARLRTTDVEPVREDVELGALIGRIVARHALFARQRRVGLNHAVPDGDTVVLGDVTLLEQAIGNLVHNAIRYSHEDGHVAVVLERVTAEAPARFVVRVEDDGPGIPEDELARVSERGFRGGEARSRHPHGLGLGLAIARDVAERHGFELHLRPREESGLVAEMSGQLRAT
jgi:signal transduction histidine kinase